MKDLPKKGDILYVPTRMYLDRGEDDIRGGKATVTSTSESYGTIFVAFKEVPNELNLIYLLENQDRWKKEYGDRWAKPDPDYG